MIVIATTTCAAYLDVPERWRSWLDNAELIRQSVEDEVRYFAALELDARGIEPFGEFIEALNDVDGEHWTFSLDDGRTEITTANRLRHITAGQNLVTEYCSSDPRCSHLLFLAADTSPPPDVLPRMLEMRWPICAPFISTYGLRGPQAHRKDGVSYPPEWRVENTMASAAAIFIQREVFKRLRWRNDPDLGLSDDPSYHYDANHLLGLETHVRMDVEAAHWPVRIGPIEERLGDKRVVR